MNYVIGKFFKETIINRVIGIITIIQLLLWSITITIGTIIIIMHVKLIDYFWTAHDPDTF